MIFQDCSTLQPPNRFGMGRPCPTAPDTGPAPGGAFRSLVDWYSAEKLPHGGTREMLPASCWSKRRGSELGPTGHMGLHRLHPSSSVRAVQGWPCQPVVTVWLQPLWPHAPSMMPTASVNGDQSQPWGPFSFQGPESRETGSISGSSPGGPSSILPRLPLLRVSPSSRVDSSNDTYGLFVELKSLNPRKVLGATCA